jgi:hypothetical protein
MRGMLRTQHIFPAVLFLGLFAMAARNAADPDLWWHLETGQLIVESKSVPHTDLFSFTRAGVPWIAHEWLSDVLLFGLQRAGGRAVLIVAFAAVITGAFLLLYLRCGSNSFVAGVATLWAALATRPLWGVRPQMLSLLLTSLWLVILERSARNPKLLYWTLPLILLWVNLHAGFALGLALSALFLVGQWIEGVMSWEKNMRSLRFPALMLALDLLLVAFNPNGVKLFWYPIETLRSAAMQNYIAEWASPNFHRAEYWPFLLILLSVFAILSCARTNLRASELLLLVVSFFAALRSIRLIPLFAMIAVPIVSRRVAAWLRRRAPKQAPAVHKTTFRPALHAAIVIAMAIFANIQITRVIRAQPQAETLNFPVGAVAFLQAHPLAGPIFNHYDWGGYLIWKLYPSTRVFIDGRADVYGESLFRDFANTFQFGDDWQDLLARWNIQTVLVPRNSALATGLREAPGWRVAYEDSQAIILSAPSKVSLPFNSCRPEMTPAGPMHDSYSRYARNYTCQSLLRVIMGANISPAALYEYMGQKSRQAEGLYLPGKAVWNV